MEYQIFGEGFVRRESVDQDWEPCAVEDIPEEVRVEMLALAERKESFKVGLAFPTGEVSAG